MNSVVKDTGKNDKFENTDGTPQSKENKKPRNGNYEYCQHKSDGGNPSRSQQKFSALAPSSASAPSSKNMYGQKVRASGSKVSRKYSRPQELPLFP